jgi:protein-S-isoprenylcysteine O-methyltransferase Ste14
MQFLFIWFGLVAATASIALLSRRRPFVDAWPAYVFALPLASRLSAVIQTLNTPRAASLHELALLLQQFAAVIFLGLFVFLFASRSPVIGPRATRTQGLVALLGTFILNTVVLVPVDPSTTTTNLLASGAALLLGTGFAIWSVAILGHCFGLFPEVRGLVQRGPYRWVRHPVYLGEIVASVGILLTRPHVLTLALLLVFIGLQYWRTVFEEHALAAAYPTDYAAYRARVARLVPGWRYPTSVRQLSPTSCSRTRHEPQEPATACRSFVRITSFMSRAETQSRADTKARMSGVDI